MDNQNRSTLINLSTKKLIPETLVSIKSEIEKLSNSSNKEQAAEIFANVDSQLQELMEKIDQVKSFFK
jgi:hypothetical protein